MDNDTASTIQNIGSKITAGADDLFSNKSKWVHTWVSKQGLPFLGLIAFLICYYKIGVGDIRLPFNSIVWIAIVLILFVAIRSAGATKNKRFNEITKSYRLSMLYIAVLMLSGNSQSDHSLFYWSILVIGFWFATWIYREKLLVPGEYPAISLLLAGIVDGANPPFDAWLFITFCFGPAIALLYWQMRSLKPVLFLIGIVVLFWITADISGPFIILGLIACALFLWVAVQAISKLARDDVSNLVYSFGLLLVSALVFFLFVGLLRLEAGTAITWWVMLVSYGYRFGFV